MGFAFKYRALLLTSPLSMCNLPCLRKAGDTSSFFERKGKKKKSVFFKKKSCHLWNLYVVNTTMVMAG